MELRCIAYTPKHRCKVHFFENIRWRCHPPTPCHRGAPPLVATIKHGGRRQRKEFKGSHAYSIERNSIKNEQKKAKLEKKLEKNYLKHSHSKSKDLDNLTVKSLSRDASYDSFLGVVGHRSLAGTSDDLSDCVSDINIEEKLGRSIMVSECKSNSIDAEK